MRNLFLVLVLVNLGFAAWHNWFAGEPRERRYAGPDVPNILLPSELEVSAETLAPAPHISEELLDAASPDVRDPVEALAGEAPIGAAAEADVTGAREEPATDALGEAAVDDAPEVAADVTEPAPVPDDQVISGQAAAVGEASATTLMCVSVGPFRELSQAAAAAANLRGDGLDPVQRAVEGDIWVGYWVYLAAIPSVPEAETILAKLNDNGIADAYVIPNSDSGNLISLGVFSEIARAGSRLSEVRALGYEATISDRTRRATVYWVDVMLAEGQTLPFESLQPPGRIMRLEQRSCDRATG